MSVLGYAGGVYYSLVSDNFHDFFTEYIPFSEDAVAYFEERQFRKRYASRDSPTSARTWPQPRGEQKVTIGKSSGLTPRLAEETNAGSDLGQKGRHSSATEDNKPPPRDSKSAGQKPKEDKQAADAEKAKAKDTTQPAPGQRKDAAPAQAAKPVKKDAGKTDVKKDSSPSSDASKQPAPEPKPSSPAPQIDHLNVPEATEPVVQDLVTLVNNIITAINASSERSQYATTLTAAKEQVNKIISEVTTLKDKVNHDAEQQIKNAHTEFDQAAKELVRRLDGEMKEQEVKWRDEYEGERERLSTSYQHRLSAELDAARKLAEQKEQNALLQQEIDLQKRFMDQVKDQVETERDGRLSKLEELSGNVSELEKLTGEWNNVVDSTLQTQHLQVALEAVRARLQSSDFPTPFINELVALKEISKDDDVVTAAIASINPVAYQRGIPSPAHLIDRFRRVAAEVRKASLLPEDAGIASHAASAVLSRLMFPKKSERGLPEGEDVEATLARTEVLLEEGDLDAAAREMNGLKGWAGVLSRDWVGECRRVLEVRQAVDVS